MNWLKQKLLGKRKWVIVVCYREEGESCVPVTSCTWWPCPRTHSWTLRVGSLKHRGRSERLCFPTNRKRHLTVLWKQTPLSFLRQPNAFIQLPPQLAGSVQAGEPTSLSFLYINFAAEMSFAKATSIKSCYSATQRGLQWTCLYSHP